MKAQRAMGIELTPRTANAVLLSVLVGTNNSYLKGTGCIIDDIFDNEIKSREIKLPNDPKKKVSLQSKREAIRKHEWLRRVDASQKDLKEVEVDSIQPLSRKMKEFLKKYQAMILDGERRTDQLDSEED